MSCCELFFFDKHHFLKTAYGVKLHFYALTKEWREVKLKKVAFHSSLSVMYKAVGTIVLAKVFPK